MTGIDRERDRPVIVRARPVVAVAVCVGSLALVALMLHGFRADPDLGGALALALVGGAAVTVVAETFRERVEVRGERVRIVHLLSTEELDLAAVASVHRAGGWGKRAYLRFTDPQREGSARRLDLTSWPPRLRRHTGTTTYPTFVTAGRLAAALRVSALSWKGSPTSPPPDLELELRRPFTWVVAVLALVALGFVVAIAVTG